MANDQLLQTVKDAGKPPSAALMLLDEIRDRVAQALPAGQDPERFISQVRRVIKATPQLEQADRRSLGLAIWHAASTGLELGIGAGAEAYLIPRKMRGRLEVTYQLGYLGLIELLDRTGGVSLCRAGNLYNKEQVSELSEAEGVARITPVLEGDPGPPIGYWAVIRLKDGSQSVAYQTAEQIADHRQRHNLQSPAWKSAPHSMAQLRVLRLASRLLPKSYDVRRAMAAEQGDAEDAPPELQPEQPQTADEPAE